MVSGKPDLLAILGDVVEVCDCKTGQPRASDDVQVMLYMYFLPRSSQKFRGKTFRGQLVYADDRVEIPETAINAEFEEHLNYLSNESSTAPIISHSRSTIPLASGSVFGANFNNRDNSSSNSISVLRPSTLSLYSLFAS